VHELLDAVQQRLALLGIPLGGLIAEERVDVGIAAVGEAAGRRGERLDAGRRVAADATEPVDQVPELLLLIRLEERRALEGPEPGADAPI
jgi:hypothetical protein